VHCAAAAAALKPPSHRAERVALGRRGEAHRGADVPEPRAAVAAEGEQQARRGGAGAEVYGVGVVPWRLSVGCRRVRWKGFALAICGEYV
jgi:hypothetical protein